MVIGAKQWTAPKLEVFGSVQELTLQTGGDKWCGGDDGLIISGGPDGTCVGGGAS